MNSTFSVDGLIQKIRSGGFSEEELVVLNYNALTKGAITVVREIREYFSAQHNQLGRLSESAPLEHHQAWGLLNALRHKLFMTYDLIENRHDCHVKAGGSHLTGKHSFAFYISYKNYIGQQASISIHQEMLGGPLEVIVHAKEIGAEPSEVARRPISEWEQAAGEYESVLVPIIRSE